MLLSVQACSATYLAPSSGTVDTAAADQLLVGALLADAALGHHHDPVGVLDRRQPVRDDQRGAPRSRSTSIAPAGRPPRARYPSPQDSA